MKTIRHTIFILIAVIAVTQYACVGSNTQKLAEKRLQDKDYHGAVKVYQTVVDSKPETPESRQAQLAIAKLYIEKMNQPQQGVQIYQDLIAAAPDSEEAIEAYYCLGIYHFKVKDYQSAQQSFNFIINKFPMLELSYNTQLMLAKSYEDVGDYEKAIEVYDNVANRYPEGKRAAQALVNKARIQDEHLRDQNAAMRTYQSIIKRYGNIESTEGSVSTAKQELRSMGAIIPKPDYYSPTQMERTLERQRQHRERNRPRRRIERSPAMEEAPDYSDSGFGVDPEIIVKPWKQLMISTIKNTSDSEVSYDEIVLNSIVLVSAFRDLDSQNYRDAGALFFYAIQLAEQKNIPIDPFIYYHLAVCYRKLGMYQRATEVLKREIKKSAQLLEHVIRMGDNQYLDENYKVAIETYNSVVGINRSKDSELYWKLGVVHQKMGNYAKEAEFCERAIAIKTDYTDALQSLAYVLFYRLNDRDRAIVLEDLANGNGGTYESEKELGAICYKYGNYTRAKTQYEAAARIAQRYRTDATLPAAQRFCDNQIVYAKVHAAMAAYKGGIAEKAQEIIDTLVSKYPDHPLIPYGNGQLDFLKGNADASVASFKASIEKDASFYAAPIALGEYYLSQENPDAAMAVWEGVIKTHPENREVRHHLNKLKRKLKTQKASEQPGGSVVFTTLKPTKKQQGFLPAKRRTIYPKNRIPKSQLPSRFFVGLSEDQVIEKYGEPAEILEPSSNLPNATRRFAYGALVPGISSTFSLEGSEFIFDENGVLGYRKVYFGDVNGLVGGGSEYPALLDEIPSELASTRCDVINEQVFAAKKYFLIVQKAQVVWELNDERWWATVYATFPARDFTSDKSIKNYKPKLKDYYIMELLVTDRNLSPDLFLTKPKGIAYANR